MDNYLKDHYGDSRGGADSINGGSPPSYNAVPRLSKPIHQGMGSQVSAAMAQVRKHKINTARVGVTQVRGRRGDIKRNLLKQWNEKCCIQNISIPQPLLNPNCSKRFRISVVWLDEFKKPHQQDINFGEQGQQEFIDHHDTTIRDARLAQLKQETLTNPLHPNFWQFHILNKYPDLNVAYYKFIQENNLMTKRVVLKKQFRGASTNQFAPPVRGRQVSPFTRGDETHDFAAQLDAYKFK